MDSTRLVRVAGESLANSSAGKLQREMCLHHSSASKKGRTATLAKAWAYSPVKWLVPRTVRV